MRCCSCCRTLRKEYDDLNSKSLEAEKEVKLVQMKIQDVNHNISKFQKDMDGKLCFTSITSYQGIVTFFFSFTIILSYSS